MLNFIGGVAAAFVAVCLYGYLKKNGLARTWYDWLLVGLLYAWVLFTIAFVGASLGEDMPKAAAFGGVIFGLVAVLGVIGLRFLFRRGFGGRKAAVSG